MIGYYQILNQEDTDSSSVSISDTQFYLDHKYKCLVLSGERCLECSELTLAELLLSLTSIFSQSLPLLDLSYSAAIAFKLCEQEA